MVTVTGLRPSLRPVVRAGQRTRRSLAGLGGGTLEFALPALWAALTQVVLRLRFRQVVLRQVSDIVVGVGGYVLGGGMIFVVFAMAFFAGTAVGLQGYVGLAEIGAESLLGVAASLGNVREIVPVVAGAAVAAQVGTAFTSELGAMRVADEIDAIEAMGLPARTYLVSTRIVSTLLAVVPLYVLALFASFFATRLIAVQTFGQPPGVYDHYFALYLPPMDVVYSLLKVVVFSVVVVLVHCYHGFHATGGPAGVGRATGRAVRTSIIAIVLINLLLSYLFWGGGSTISVAG